MYARAVQQLPLRARIGYRSEVDRYRCLAGRDPTGITLWSRRGNLFNDQFPTVAEACEHLPPDTLLDAELIALDKDGRVSFTCSNIIVHKLRRSCFMKTLTPLIGMSDTLDTSPAKLIPSN